MTRAVIRTARLHLRPVADRDKASVLAGLNDLGVSGWLSVVPYPYTAADFDAFQGKFAQRGSTFAIRDQDGFVGILGLENARLGYWLCPQAQGRGYATEAARAVLGWHFADGGCPVTSGYFEGNAPSAHVLAKLGFSETGRRLNFCRPLNRDRPHVDLILTESAYSAALRWQAESARLTYRPLQATDGAALHAIVAHFDVTRHLAQRWPWPADPIFSQSRAQPFHGPGFSWGIFRQGMLIGSVGVAAGALGYLLAPAAWGQGYATEACQTALAHARSQGEGPISASIWADNAPSRRVLEKLGFVLIGESTATSAARPSPSSVLTLRLDGV